MKYESLSERKKKAPSDVVIHRIFVRVQLLGDGGKSASLKKEFNADAP